MTTDGKRPLTIYLVAGEESGDQLGAKLMDALRRKAGGREIRFQGVGGAAMQARGLRSLFPMTDISIMGILAVIARLPKVVRRIYQTVAAVTAARPDALVIIDAPGFNQPVAQRVRRRLPGLPVINYVSPSVWAWRPKRAPRMRAYIDHVLAVKPFEPEAHRRLGGPPCSYVGHPLVERIGELRASGEEREALGGAALRLVVLPGSRRAEIARLMEPFGAAVARLAASVGPIEVVLPAVSHLAEEIRARAQGWPVQPRIVEGEEAKYAAFRRAQVALAASGTVTLELALAGVPMVVAYKVSKFEQQLRHFITVPSIVLANLILGENVVPEYIQWDCTPEKLGDALALLARDTPERRRQLDGFARLGPIMEMDGAPPSDRAAELVLREIERRSGRAGA